MPPVGTPMNDKLPSEILGIIFEYFTEPKVDNNSLEDLLSVCRSWKNAALAHHALWGRICITIGHKETFQACLFRVKSRLFRAGCSAPLSIDISVDLLDPRLASGCPTKSLDCCDVEANDFAHQLVEILSGSNGNNCDRWKTLRISLCLENIHHSDYIKNRLKWTSLTYPTPSLVLLLLDNITVHERILPLCPSLRDAHLLYTNSMHLPDLSNTFTFEWVSAGRNSRNPLDFSSLCRSTNLQALTIKFWAPVTVITPSTLPFLRQLTIEGYLLPPEFLNVEFPILKKLAIKCGTFNMLQNIIGWKGIKIAELQYLEVTMRWLLPCEFRAPDLMALVLSITNEETMIAVDEFFFLVIFNLIWKAKSDIGGIAPLDPVLKVAKKKLILSRLPQRSQIVLTKDESTETLSAIAAEQGLRLYDQWKIHSTDPAEP